VSFCPAAIIVRAPTLQFLLSPSVVNPNGLHPVVSISPEPGRSFKLGKFQQGKHGTSGFDVKDEDLVACLQRRGVLNPRNEGNIELVFLNACGSLEVCRLLQTQDVCGIPVMLGWGDAAADSRMCARMVSSCCFCMWDTCGWSLLPVSPVC
jgi:hypothetical protein